MKNEIHMNELKFKLNEIEVTLIKLETRNHFFEFNTD